MTSWKMKLGGLLISIGGGLQASDNGTYKVIGAILIAVGGLLTTQGRDNDTTSEKAGAK